MATAILSPQVEAIGLITFRPEGLTLEDLQGHSLRVSRTLNDLLYLSTDNKRRSMREKANIRFQMDRLHSYNARLNDLIQLAMLEQMPTAQLPNAQDQSMQLIPKAAAAQRSP
jgi:hypothetical protein